MAERIDRKRGWESLGTVAGTFTLFGLRHRLRERNLYDRHAPDPPDPDGFPGRPTVRTVDGTKNDLAEPAMGAVGAQFGRNGPSVPRMDGPAPSLVSEELLARRSFQPATTLNLLAAAWLQFEVHDWMQHREKRDAPLDTDPRPFEQAEGSTPGCSRYVSDQTHWWDASQLYGASSTFVARLREGQPTGRIKVGPELLQAAEEFMHVRPAPVPNLWIGLALFNDLFAREHNAICDLLEEDEPGLAGDALFDKARLINAAVMAKIHTVEWTPAIIAHPTTEHSIRSTWWGVLGERAHRRWGRIGPGEVLSGIPGSRTHHDGVRYSLTEEFVAVYRLHPLIPDEVAFRRVADDSPISVDGGTSLPFGELAVGAGPVDRPRRRLDEIEYANALYSLAVAHPGAIALHNYPEFLRNLPVLAADDGTPQKPVDLAARDIVRTRECGVPRYNAFRRVFRLPPARSFMEMTNGDDVLAREIQEVYRDPEDVDLVVGLYAERKPPGFAFSDTAFRVFLLMAARRLRSDRFFTTDYTPEVYTATGLQRIENATMGGMLWEHYSELRPALEHVDNVFKPWPTTS